MQLTQNDKRTLILNANEILTVTADAGSSASVTRLGDKAGDDAQSVTTVAASTTETFGPFTNATRWLVSCPSGSLSFSTAPQDLTDIKIDGGSVEIVESYSDADSRQPIWADLTLEAEAGTSEAGDTAFLAPMMGNVLGDALTKENNTIAGLIGANSITGARATVLPQAAVMGVLMDGAVNSDSIVHAHIDGGDPSTETHARAAFGVSQFNNNALTSVDYGLDLKYTPSAEVDALLSGSAEPFKCDKGLLRSPNNVVILEGDGAPVDGTTGDNFAGPGSLYIDFTNGNAYLQTSLITTPVWKLITRAS